jgi:hypothetical protein
VFVVLNKGNDMMTYKITFMGKPKGAAGCEYSITKFVSANSKWDALMEIFNNYEGVHFVEYEYA